MKNFVMPLFLSPEVIVPTVSDDLQTESDSIVYTAEIISGGRLKLEFEGMVFCIDNKTIRDFYEENPVARQLNNPDSENNEPKVSLHPWGMEGERLAVVSSSQGDDAYIIRPHSNEIIVVDYEAWYRKKKEALIGLLRDCEEAYPVNEVHLFCCDAEKEGLGKKDLYEDLKNRVLDVVVKFGNFFKGNDCIVRLGLAIDNKGIIERMISQESKQS